MPVSTPAAKIIGEAIRERRRSRGWSQEELAERLDIHPNYLGEVERGEKSPSLELLVRLAGRLHCRVRDLVAEV